MVATLVVITVVVATPYVVDWIQERESRKFDAIEIGMTEDEVRRLFGGPDRVDDAVPGESCRGVPIRRTIYYEKRPGLYLSLSVDERGVIVCEGFMIIKI